MIESGSGGDDIGNDVDVYYHYMVLVLGALAWHVTAHVAPDALPFLVVA